MEDPTCGEDMATAMAMSWQKFPLPPWILSLRRTKRHYRDRHEVIDDDSEAYCCPPLCVQGQMVT